MRARGVWEKNSQSLDYSTKPLGVSVEHKGSGFESCLHHPQGLTLGKFLSSFEPQPPRLATVYNNSLRSWGAAQAFRFTVAFARLALRERRGGTVLLLGGLAGPPSPGRPQVFLRCPPPYRSLRHKRTEANCLPPRGRKARRCQATLSLYFTNQA